MRPEKYLRYIVPPSVFGIHRTKSILKTNPTIEVTRSDAASSVITVFDYDAAGVAEKETREVEQCYLYKGNGKVTWINIDGIRKAEVERIDLVLWIPKTEGGTMYLRYFSGLIDVDYDGHSKTAAPFPDPHAY